MLRRIEQPSLYLCFNKSVADEAKARMPSHVQASTFHSFFLRGLYARGIKPQRADTRKSYSLAKQLFPREDSYTHTGLQRLAGYAKAFNLSPNSPPKDFSLLSLHFGLDADDEKLGAMMPALLRESLSVATEKGLIDFDDMLWIPAQLGSVPKAPSIVAVDEAQDTNPCQLALLERLDPERLVAVGDPFQAIYGFRGAGTDSMDILTQEFSLTHLPLSITYRCPLSHVELAKAIVPHIEASPTAQPGTVDRNPAEPMLPGDLVICRFNRPLVELARTLLRQRKPFTYLGNGLQATLKSLIYRPYGRKRGDYPLQAWKPRFTEWMEEEIARLLHRDLEGPAAALEENCMILLDFSHDSDLRSTQDLEAMISQLFEPGHGPLLSTIHKAKGLEASRVHFIDSPQPKWAKKGWELDQERNLRYVALTRSRDYLNILEP